jgi:hypothetical protein
MPTNPFFTYLPGTAGKTTQEQSLLEDLYVEAIQINGFDVYYLPRADNDVDPIYGETQQKVYNKAVKIEMYMTNFTSFGDNHTFNDKFGYMARDHAQLVVSKRSFSKTFPGLLRPREGDLVYIPIAESMFEITFVDTENSSYNFHGLGRQQSVPYLYDIHLEFFKYSNEQFATGIPDIDSLVARNAYTIQIKFDEGVGTFIKGETAYQGDNLAFATATGTVSKWISSNLTLQMTGIRGSFANSSNIFGANSSADYIHYAPESLDDEFDKFTFNIIMDNQEIKTEANTYISWDETNPFGEP